MTKQTGAYIADLEERLATAERAQITARARGEELERENLILKAAVRNAWWRLKNPTMGGEDVGQARDILESARHEVTP